MSRNQSSKAHLTNRPPIEITPAVSEYGAQEQKKNGDYCEVKPLNLNQLESNLTLEYQNNTVLSKFSLSNLSSSRVANTVKESPLQKSGSPAQTSVDFFYSETKTQSEA